MKRVLRESLELKYLAFVIILLIIGILWAGIASLSLEKIYGKSVNFVLWNMIITALGISVAAVLFWVVLRKLVVKPIKSIERAAKSLAEGDLSFHLEMTTEDEIGRMSKAISESLRSLSGIFQRVKNGSKRVIAVAEKVEIEFKNVSENTKLESEAIGNIATSLEQMNSAAGEISENTQQLAASTEEKAASMQEMVTSIGQVADSAQELSLAVDSTAASIEQLSATIREVADKAEELASASEETLAATEEISSAVKEVEQNAKESARLSEKVKNDASTFGIASVEKTIEGIQNIKSSFDNTAHYIKKLGGRSDEIGKILNVIDEITDQTTLLALNAAILAAQAGEHGKGFSVVADEIKDLAERTSFSTREIAELIQAVQQEVKEAILAMDDGLRSVEVGLRVAKDADDALHKIVESSIQSAEMSDSIERSTTEQAKTTRLVSSAMERVKNMVAHIARTTQEQNKGALLITKATEKMRNVANHVKTATGEQLISSKHISEAMELVSEKSLQIAKAVHEQKTGSNQIFDSIEKIKDIPKSTMDRVFSINQALNGLFKNSELVTQELKRITLFEEGLSTGKDAEVLKFGIEPVGASPAEMPEKFNLLAEYLSKKLVKKIELRVVSDYEGALRDIGQGTTQFCFMSPITYVLANDKYGAEILAKILVGGKSTCRSVMIAKSDSKINMVKDIKSHKFAFGNPHSVSSYVAPRIMLLDAGIDLKDLLHYEYVGPHEDVANAVISGKFDAGAVTESIAYQFKDKGLKFIKFSEELPGFVICSGKNVPTEIRDSMELALTALTDAAPEAASILHSIYKKYSGFEKAFDNEFSLLRTMMGKAGIIK
jgi:phosphate/phosphite/phosphonate ABC transporter binding protein